MQHLRPAVATAATVLLLASCARDTPSASDVAPIGAGPPASTQHGEAPRVGGDARSALGVEPDAPPLATWAEPSGVSGDAAALEEATEAVQELLDRYDRALTALVAAPHAADDPAHPVRREWDLVVPPGSALSVELLARSRARAAQQVVIRPGPAGLAYRHHVVSVGSLDEWTIPFTWCGHSPGIGVHERTGEVLDEAVAHGRGTGMLRREDDRWWLEALDELDLAVLAPGSPDPCPDEVAAARGA